MFIIDFNSDRKRAFLHGLVKGLAAPVCLYHGEALPQVKVEYLKPPTARRTAQALAEDWYRVGDDLYRAIENESPKIEQAAEQKSK